MADLSEIFDLFSYFDIPQIYSRYSVGIDFFISFFLFFGVAKMSLGRRFQSNYVPVSAALVLSVGFVLMEREMNFSLATFGPIAALIFVFIVGAVLYGLLRHFEAGHAVALPASFAAVYACLNLVSPSVFDWIAGRQPWINGVLLLLFIVSLFKLGWALFPKRSAKDFGRDIHNLSVDREDSERGGRDQEQERHLLKHELKLAKKSLRSGEDVLRHLDIIVGAVDSHGMQEGSRQKIIGALESIYDGQHHAEAFLQRLEAMYRKVGSHDSKRYEILKRDLQSAQGKHRQSIEKELGFEERKLEADQEVGRLRERLSGLVQVFNNFLREAVQRLNGHFPVEAKNSLLQAREAEKEIIEELSKVKRLEKILIDLAKAEKKEIKKNT